MTRNILDRYQYHSTAHDHSGVARGLACHAEHDLNFFKPKFFFGYFLHENDEMLSHVMSFSKAVQANQICKFLTFERSLTCKQAKVYLPN